MKRILIVDDEVAIRKALERFFTELGYAVITADDGAAALQCARETPVDVAIVDLMMPRMDGVECIRQLKTMSPSTVPIVMTAHGSIASAVEAMRIGAYHYITKPFELEEVARVVAMALEVQHLKSENQTLKQELRQQRHTGEMIGQSAEMQCVAALIEKVAATDSTVLVLGESGTGKELVARAIHHQSLRAGHPLITVNCAAIPEDLLETELFGHVKGAFTGATETHHGKFAAADGGTIFLDEIGDMSLKLQVKILRVLQERRFEPVGSTKSVSADVRIIAATHQDLERAVKDGRFREDLYYRLHVIPIKLSPLRGRRADIPALVAHFVRKYRAAHQRVEGITEAAVRALTKGEWPGNIRELENTIERLVILKGEGWIDVADLALAGDAEASFKAPALEIPDGGLSFRTAVNAFERELILRALQKTGWNKNRAAHLLQLNRTTLVEKIKKKKLTNAEGDHVQDDQLIDR